MKIVIAYSSKTGNTKFFCEKVYENLKDDLDIEITTIKELKDYSKYDLVIIGFWVDRSTANREAKKQIKNIENKKIALLGTLGASTDSEHGKKVIENVGKLINKSSEYLGVKLARGKVSEKLTNKIKLLPLPKNIIDKMYEASINSREPNEYEINEAINFIKDLL